MEDEENLQFVALEVLPQKCLVPHAATNRYTTSFGEFSAKQAVKIYWTLSELDLEISLNVSSKFKMNPENDDYDSEATFQFSDELSYPIQGAITNEPVERLKYGWPGGPDILFGRYFYSGINIGTYLGAPRYAAQYSPEVPFEQRSFVFPISVEVYASTGEMWICSDVSSENKGPWRNTLCCPMELEFMGKSAQVYIHAQSTYLDGVFYNSGAGSLKLSNPKFFQI